MGSAITKIFTPVQAAIGAVQSKKERKARRTAGEQAAQLREEIARSGRAREEEELRRRIFSGIRTGSPQGILGGEQVGRTTLLGG